MTDKKDDFNGEFDALWDMSNEEKFARVFGLRDDLLNDETKEEQTK